jgi:hypothetical protein
MLAFMLPTSHVIPFGALMAERFLFAPSLGPALLAGLGVQRLLQGGAASRVPMRAITAGLVALLVVAGSWRTVRRAAD